MEETLKNIFIIIVAIILKFFQSIYELVTNKYFFIAVVAGYIIFVFGKTLSNIDNSLSE